MADILDVPDLQLRTDNQFRAELIARARDAALNPDFIAAVISLESGFDANVQNRQGHNYLGLIQFSKKYFPFIAARARMAVHWDDLRTMTATEQVPLVIAYFKGTTVKRNSSAVEYYTATFMPSYVGYPLDTVLAIKDSDEPAPGTGQTKGEVYRANRTLDANGDDRITIDDLRVRIEGIIQRASLLPRVPVEMEEPMPAQMGSVGLVLTSVFFFTP